jgi:hypothetical protein
MTDERKETKDGTAAADLDTIRAWELTRVLRVQDDRVYIQMPASMLMTTHALFVRAHHAIPYMYAGRSSTNTVIGACRGPEIGEWVVTTAMARLLVFWKGVNFELLDEQSIRAWEKKHGSIWLKTCRMCQASVAVELKSCATCNLAWYCGPRCQKHDYSVHSKGCRMYIKDE